MTATSAASIAVQLDDKAVILLIPYVVKQR